MNNAMNKFLRLIAEAVQQLETSAIHSLGAFSIQIEPPFIRLATVFLRTGRAQENEDIGFVHQSGPRLFLMLKHPQIQFETIKVYDIDSEERQILETRRYRSAVVITLDKTVPVRGIELVDVVIPNPVFKLYAHFVPGSEFLLNTVYWEDYERFSEYMKGFNRLLMSQELLTADFLANYINLALGLPFVTTVGILTSIEEDENTVKITVATGEGDVRTLVYDIPPGASTVLISGQQVRGFERVFDVVEVLQ